VERSAPVSSGQFAVFPNAVSNASARRRKVAASRSNALRVPLSRWLSSRRNRVAARSGFDARNCCFSRSSSTWLLLNLTTASRSPLQTTASTSLSSVGMLGRRTSSSDAAMRFRRTRIRYANSSVDRVTCRRTAYRSRLCCSVNCRFPVAWLSNSWQHCSGRRTGPAGAAAPQPRMVGLEAAVAWAVSRSGHSAQAER